MEKEKSWLKFLTSGKVEDYLTYVNSCKGSEILGTGNNPFHDRGVGYKAGECGGERQAHNHFH